MTVLQTATGGPGITDVRHKRKLTREERTAYHEAGHAVAHFFVGHPAKRATIIPDEAEGTLGHVQAWASRALGANLSGEVSYREEDPMRLARGLPSRRLGSDGKPVPRERSEAWIERRVQLEIMTLLAGGIAEKRAGGRANHVGARSDREKANELAFQLMSRGLTRGSGRRQAEALLRWLTIRAEELVAHWWDCVEEIAEALLAHKTLTGKDVREAIKRAIEPENRPRREARDRRRDRRRRGRTP